MFLRLIQIRLATPSLGKIRQLVKPIRLKPEPPIRVPQTPSGRHSHAQRNAFRHRGAHQQSRSFARWNQSLRRSPNSNRFAQIVSDDFPILHLMSNVAPLNRIA
jgi:hypothetical protein